MALSSEELGAVEAKRLDPDQHLALPRRGNGPVFDLQRLGSAWRVKNIARMCAP